MESGPVALTPVPAQTEEVTEEYLRSLSMEELIPFLAGKGVAVPTSVQVSAKTVVDWVIENLT